MVLVKFYTVAEPGSLSCFMREIFEGVDVKAFAFQVIGSGNSLELFQWVDLIECIKRDPSFDLSVLLECPEKWNAMCLALKEFRGTSWVDEVLSKSGYLVAV